MFVFNLVAKNTREGSVMAKLLEKMEQMRTDLGSDLVYDFIGEVIEDNYDSLSDLMQKAIMERENLDEIIENMDKTISDEHKKLIDLVREERLVDDEINLPSLKRQKDNWMIHRIPLRSYADFTTYILEKKELGLQSLRTKRYFG